MSCGVEPKPREVITNRMGRQEVELGLRPEELLQRVADEPLAFVLDGGSVASWGCGRAFFSYGPVAWMQIDAAGHVTTGGPAPGSPSPASPRERVQGEGSGHEANVQGRSGKQENEGEPPPLTLLERFVERFDTAAADEPPFVVVALSYELGRSIEHLRGARPLSAGQLLLHVAAYDWMLVHDYRKGTDEIVTRPGGSADAARVAAQLRDLAARPVVSTPTHAAATLQPDQPAAAHEAAVRHALELIAAGDIYQVNLAQRFRAAAPEAADLFAALQRDHPMPFAAYLDLGERQLVSNSPECLLAVDGRNVATFPIKGTRARGVGAEDERMQQELLADGKERAEHVMIVDLERNDLGRVAVTGSVRVPRRLQLETFATLHHMVSRVEAEIRPEVGVAELLRAVFPGGSITGAPKIRAMEVIEMLEPVQRGFYTGSIGLLGRRWARLNIAIRTAEITASELSYHAGGGIVADSNPSREQAEVMLKTTAFAQALAKRGI